MSESVKLSYNNQIFEFPLIEGTENEKGIDIKTLRSSTGLITYDPGFKNTGSCKSSVTFLNGEEGILRYRGYSIEDLCDRSSFIEVAFLLIFGELPNKEELDLFNKEIKIDSLVDEDLKMILKSFPKAAHPMGVLSSLTSALIAFNPSSVDVDSESDMREAIIMLLAKFPILASWTQRKVKGLPLNYANTSLSYVENIAHMMFKRPHEEYSPSPVVVSALNKLLILHADHEQNASTSTVRLAASSGVNPFASISSGFTSLWGPLHGGANEAALNMLREIGDVKNISKFIEKAKDKNDPFKLMGFGHRVYKNYDPRAKVMQKTCHEVLAEIGKKDDKILQVALELEKIALKDDYFIEKKLYPNIDFYSGITLNAMGFPSTMFTPLFAVARTAGWIAHWKEMYLDPKNRIGRPRQLYIGEKPRKFLELKDRS